MIYAIGDSHSMMLVPKENYCGGQTTAYSIRTIEKNIRDSLSKKVDKDKDIIVSVFGEIDCRYRVFYIHDTTKRTIASVVQEIIDNYLKFINSLMNEGYNIYVISAVPAQKYGGNTQGDAANLLPRGNGGSDEERREITSIFNWLLEVNCKKLGIKFINMFDYLVGEDGFNKKEMMRDSIHYNFMGNWFEETFLNER